MSEATRLALASVPRPLAQTPRKAIDHRDIRVDSYSALGSRAVPIRITHVPTSVTIDLTKHPHLSGRREAMLAESPKRVDAKTK